MKHTIEIILIILGISSISFGCLILKEENKDKILYNNAIKTFSSNFNDVMQKQPKNDLKITDLNISYNKINLITDKQKRKNLLIQIDELKKYLKIKANFDNLLVNGILINKLTEKEIKNIETDYNQLLPKYKALLYEQMLQLKEQNAEITRIINLVKSLFTDEQYSVVNSNITRENYNNILTIVNSLKQENIKQAQLLYLKRVEEEIIKKEEKLKQEAEIARIKKEKEIENAWIILNVPYISQNKNNVLNGCELACLLMGLQYKGYLKNMDLVTYATNVPKSNDPFHGFTYDIF